MVRHGDGQGKVAARGPVLVSHLKLTVSSWGEVALDKRELRKVMRGAGNDVRTKTARLINATAGTGQRYRGGGGSNFRGAYHAGPYVASAPGEAPVRVSGALRQSLKTFVFKSAEGFAVRARQFYALFLEAGARGGGNPGRGGVINPKTRRPKRARGRYAKRVLAPRPFLDRVMQREAPELDRRVGAALRNALTWKQTK